MHCVKTQNNGKWYFYGLKRDITIISTLGYTDSTNKLTQLSNLTISSPFCNICESSLLSHKKPDFAFET